MGNLRPTLYIGVTNDLTRRVLGEHKPEVIESFTKKYRLTKLLYYEVAENIEAAILREKQLKHWNREWKLNLIKTINPAFRDLSSDLVG